MYFYVIPAGGSRNAEVTYVTHFVYMRPCVGAENTGGELFLPELASTGIEFCQI